MQYREDVVKLFEDWHKENVTATVLFKGYFEGFPEKIYVYNFKYRKDIVALQESYIQLLSRLLGENSLYGQKTYAVELRLVCPKKLEDVTWKLEGTV